MSVQLSELFQKVLDLPEPSIVQFLPLSISATVRFTVPDSSCSLESVLHGGPGLAVNRHTEMDVTDRHSAGDRVRCTDIQEDHEASVE